MQTAIYTAIPTTITLTTPGEEVDFGNPKVQSDGSCSWSGVNPDTTAPATLDSAMRLKAASKRTKSSILGSSYQMIVPYWDVNLGKFDGTAQVRLTFTAPGRHPIANGVATINRFLSMFGHESNDSQALIQDMVNGAYLP